MGRGDRRKTRWKKDRQRAKKARLIRQAKARSEARKG
jgi:hypothetical protein